MPRHNNVNWDLPAGEPAANGDRSHKGEDIMLSLLMDLRDELQALNRTFECPSFRQMPDDLRRLRIATERLDRRMARKNPIPRSG